MIINHKLVFSLGTVKAKHVEPPPVIFASKAESLCPSEVVLWQQLLCNLSWMRIVELTVSAAGWSVNCNGSCSHGAWTECASAAWAWVCAVHWEGVGVHGVHIQTQLWIITSQIHLNTCEPQKFLGRNATAFLMWRYLMVPFYSLTLFKWKWVHDDDPQSCFFPFSPSHLLTPVQLYINRCVWRAGSEQCRNDAPGPSEPNMFNYRHKQQMALLSFNFCACDWDELHTEPKGSNDLVLCGGKRRAY